MRGHPHWPHPGDWGILFVQVIERTARGFRIKQQRLVVFCTSIDADLEALRAALAPLLERLGFAGATLKPVTLPEGLHQAGWMAISIRVPRPSEGSSLAAHLGELTHAFAQVLKDEAVGVYVDASALQARACLHGPGGFPRLLDGAPFHVIRQVAAWIEADAAELSRYFSTPSRPPDLEGPVDLSVVDPLAGDPSTDEEDRFVEGKLQHARELMDRYLSRRK